MPRENFGPGHTFLAKEEILTYEEMAKVVSSLLPLGLKKVRITGGEPLLRKDIHVLIELLRSLDPELDLALTTNGVLLHKYADILYQKGLNRVTVSLDAVEQEMFQQITDSRKTPSEVFAGIDQAIKSGMNVKVNCVVKKGVNENQIVPLAKRCIQRKIPVRFIEFMDVGSTNSWNLNSVITGAEMRKVIQRKFGPLVQKNPNYYGEVAKQWTILDKEYDFGFIESISSPFCGSCTRARISSNGHLFTCLFSEKGHDLLSMMRMDAEEEDIANAITKIWNNRNDKYSEGRKGNHKDRIPVEMSYIGG